MGFVRQFAQKVTVLHLGKILSEGTMEMVSSDQQVIRAYLGRSRTRQRKDDANSPEMMPAC
jgi:urea transport system ATP-binding protein